MENKLRELQLTQLEILKVFDKICVNNGLKYSLYAGSLLGAVRHKGFIPWDDDLDVCMSREDYNKFIDIWNKTKPEGYILQNKENSPEFVQSFSKIRKDHTTFLQYESEIGKYHTGIFLDIFPTDRIPKGKIKQILFRWDCMRYQLYTREFVPPKSGILVRAISGLLLGITPKKRRSNVRTDLLKKITKYNSDTSLETIFIETMASLRTAHSPKLLDNYTFIQFEDKEFMCFSEWNDYLTRKFGEYMQLPPEEERGWRHHPIILDFDHNYEELDSKNV